MKQLHPDTLISTASIVTRHDSFAVGSSVTSNIICRAGLAGCLLAWSNVKLLVIVLFVYTLNMCFPAPSTTTHISNEVLIVWKHYLQTNTPSNDVLCGTTTASRKPTYAGKQNMRMKTKTNPYSCYIPALRLVSFSNLILRLTLAA